MTTVRHETVHYTAAEMAAKEAADEVAKAKRQKTVLIIVGVVSGLLVLGCLGCLLLGSFAGESVAPISTRTPTSGKVVEPTLFPTPAYLTVAAIEQERGALTDIQKEQYDQSVLGEVIQFQGQVIEVHENGSVSINEGGFFTTVKLLGIPRDAAMALQKDQLIEGMGTIADVDTFLGLMIEIQITSWSSQ